MKCSGVCVEAGLGINPAGSIDCTLRSESVMNGATGAVDTVAAYWGLECVKSSSNPGIRAGTWARGRGETGLGVLSETKRYRVSVVGGSSLVFSAAGDRGRGSFVGPSVCGVIRYASGCNSLSC